MAERLWSERAAATQERVCVSAGRLPGTETLIRYYTCAREGAGAAAHRAAEAAKQQRHSSAASAAGASGSAPGRLQHAVPQSRTLRLQQVAHEGAAARAAPAPLPCLAGRQRCQQPRHSLTVRLTWRASAAAEVRAPPEEGSGYMRIFLPCFAEHLGLRIGTAAWRSELSSKIHVAKFELTLQNYSDHVRGTATWRRPRRTPPAVVGDSVRSSGTRFVATSRIWQVQGSQSTLRNTIRIGRTLARASGRPENPSGHPYGATGPPGGRQGIFSGFTREPQHLISDSAITSLLFFTNTNCRV